MALYERKFPVLALSACSIPVMLAFAGHGVRSTGLQSPAVTGESAIFNLEAEPRKRPSIDTRLEKTNCTGEEVEELVSLSDAAPPWMCMSLDGQHFWVAKGASISTYNFTHPSDTQEDYELAAEVSAVQSGGSSAPGTDENFDNYVSLQLSDDGQWLYQLFEQTGAMAVYEVNGGELTQIEWLTA
jgi:hypothetical protein